jgi:hypothetical protein
MAKVQFQVDGFDANQESIFNDDVTFDGNVDANSISIGGSDIFDLVGGPSSVEVSSNIFLSANTKYFVDTNFERTLTLPASPYLGDEIYIFDALGSAGTNNITIDSNSLKINGSVQDLLIDADAGAVSLVYTGSTYGWKV